MERGIVAVGIALLALTPGPTTGAAADGISPAPFVQAHEPAPEKAVQIGNTWFGLIHEQEPHDRFRLVTLASQGGAWKTARSTVHGDEYAYYTLVDGPTAVNVGGREYAYFSLSVTRQGTAHSGSGEVEFDLADVRTLEVFTLLYEGELRGKKIKGSALPDAALSKHAEALRFLQAKLAASPLVLQPTDKDPYAWLDAWRTLNPRLAEPGAEAFGPLAIAWPLLDSDPMAGAAQGSETGTLESARYRVRSFFRDSVIAYDKQTRQYFPVWAERCAHGCNKTLVRLDKGVLVFAFDEFEPALEVEVDLDKRVVQGARAED